MTSSIRVIITSRYDVTQSETDFSPVRQRSLQVELEEREFDQVCDVTDKGEQQTVFVGGVWVRKIGGVESTLQSAVVLEDQVLAFT